MSQTRVSSLKEFKQFLKNLPGPNQKKIKDCDDREPELTKPQGSLGRLEQITKWLAGWQDKYPPRIDNKSAIIFAGSHGITAQNVSAFPSEVNHQMILNFQSGGAAINQLCNVFNIELKIMEVALEIPTRDFSEKPAMGDLDCAEAISFGMSGPNSGADILCLGEMGIGNTTASAAICLALYGGHASDWVGPGTGVTGEKLQNKINIVQNSVRLHKNMLTDSIEILRHLGGREMAAICGAIISARLLKIPVLLDGYVTCAAAATLKELAPNALDHCMVAHISGEPGHKHLLKFLEKEPLLDLGMRLGECSGAALAVGLLNGAVACHNGMSTFGEAQVSSKSSA